MVINPNFVAGFDDRPHIWTEYSSYSPIFSRQVAARSPMISELTQLLIALGEAHQTLFQGPPQQRIKEKHGFVSIFLIFLVFFMFFINFKISLAGFKQSGFQRLTGSDWTIGRVP